MSRALQVLCIIALTIGCATPEQRHDVDGDNVHRINCSGRMQHITDCYADAWDICDEAGYLILSQTVGSGIQVGEERIYMSYEEIRMMTIRCKSGLSEEEIQVIEEASSRRDAASQE